MSLTGALTLGHNRQLTMCLTRLRLCEYHEVYGPAEARRHRSTGTIFYYAYLKDELVAVLYGTSTGA